MLMCLRQELAALEAEAEALALEDQRKSSAPAGNGAVHLDRYSVSLADESQAHRAMVRSATVWTSLSCAN